LGMAQKQLPGQAALEWQAEATHQSQTAGFGLTRKAAPMIVARSSSRLMAGS